MKIFIIIWLVSLFPSSSLLSNLSNQQIDLAEEVYLQAEENNINPEQFARLVYCESSFNSLAKGDYRSETGEYMANGIMQWWKVSYELYSKKYNFKGNYWSSEDQITLAAKVISKEKNGWKNWLVCGKIAGYDENKKIARK